MMYTAYLEKSNFENGTFFKIIFSPKKINMCGIGCSVDGMKGGKIVNIISLHAT